MTNKDLADIIFPNITKSVEDYEEMYKERNLEEGRFVTRFAPSPTGFFHLGGMFGALIDFIIAKNTNGIFYLRTEDTDTAREIEGASKLIIDTLKKYNLTPSEYELDGEIIGSYGPYVQSERKEIYHTFIKHLIEIGRAYPCFCTKEELDAMRSEQEACKMRTGYYGDYAKCRNLSIEEAIEKIKNGEQYVIRFKSLGNWNKRFVFDDLVKGKLELPENDQDIVIMKSNDLLPTYHLAHLVDDHLMHTTHVVRGEEWLPSLPTHVELFNAFGYKMPKYIHTPLILKKDGDSVRKLSKRKDPEATMSYYEEAGYPVLAVIESLMTIINSNYEIWHTANPDKSFLDFKYDPKKMSSAGAFYDLEKLDNISKNIISKMSATDVYNETLNWAEKYDEEFAGILKNNKEYAISVFNIEREQKKPRKDYVCYSKIKNEVWYMFDELFDKYDKVYDYQKITDKDEIKKITDLYISKYYDENDDKDTWFNKIKLLCDELDYASDMKEYKLNPDNFKGSVADVSTVLRVTLTCKSMTPDLYEIMRLLGKEKIESRFNSKK